jgi:hypothetical protein
MKKTLLIAAAAVMAACTAPEEKGAKDAFAKYFYLGTALNEAQITGADTKGVETIKKHFNSIVAFHAAVLKVAVNSSKLPSFFEQFAHFWIIETLTHAESFIRAEKFKTGSSRFYQFGKMRSFSAACRRKSVGIENIT